MSERLQKFLARAGVASRRHAEELITAGRVSVNNQRVTELGTKVEPSDLVTVDGALVTAPETTSWYLLHKPPGVVTTLSDPEGRPTVAGLLAGVEQRVFPVGRLDWDAEGALLLTNDGAAAHRLLHPSFEVPRTYLVKVKGTPTDETLARLVEGVRLEDGPARAMRAERFEATERNTWLLLQVGEGRPHLVKRLCAAVGHPVVRLFRPSQAGISVAGLQPGELRPLTPEEVERVEAVAAGGAVPEPAAFLPPRRHGRPREDGEGLPGETAPGAGTARAPGLGESRGAGGGRPSRGRPSGGGQRPERAAGGRLGLGRPEKRWGGSGGPEGGGAGRSGRDRGAGPRAWGAAGAGSFGGPRPSRAPSERGGGPHAPGRRPRAAGGRGHRFERPGAGAPFERGATSGREGGPRGRGGFRPGGEARFEAGRPFGTGGPEERGGSGPRAGGRGGFRGGGAAARGAPSGNRPRSAGRGAGEGPGAPSRVGVPGRPSGVPRGSGRGRAPLGGRGGGGRGRFGALPRGGGDRRPRPRGPGRGGAGGRGGGRR